MNVKHNFGNLFIYPLYAYFFSSLIYLNLWLFAQVKHITQIDVFYFQ